MPTCLRPVILVTDLVWALQQRQRRPTANYTVDQSHPPSHAIHTSASSTASIRTEERHAPFGTLAYANALRSLTRTRPTHSTAAKVRKVPYMTRTISTCDPCPPN